MPFQKECFYPHIQVWDEVDGQSVLLARVCGHLKANQLAYKSKTNRMKIGLMNLYEKGHGFSASVNFVYGKKKKKIYLLQKI